MDVYHKFKQQSIGHYKLQDCILGKGGFATVFLARHKTIGCKVAFKVINTDKIKEEYVFQNLEREANILESLHHPNIIRLYETIQFHNLYCLSLEWIRGVNLYCFLKKKPHNRISEKTARIFFFQMLSAVEYMHRLQIIHRDLKLENILVEFGHVIKIIDFGLSNVYYPCLKLRTHCGSIEYAAPELLRKMSVYGLAADTWSLGIILYAMVVGRMPFRFPGKLEGEKYKTSSHKIQFFLQRTAKGLMQENWELMEDLSEECWKLLHDMLEPDQFQRIPIEEAIRHYWITKDRHLQASLPQRKKGLQRLFRPQIIAYLADLLNTSKMQIEKHINAGYYDNNKTACMFHIMRDILVKEVVYPPEDFQASFLYKFQNWKESQTSMFPIRQYSKQYKAKKKFNEKEEAGVLCFEKTIQVDNQHKKFSKSDIKTKHPNDSKLYSHLKGTGSEKLNVTDKEEPARKVCSNFLKDKDLDTDSKHEQRSEQQNVFHTPYRSYKHNRPENKKPSVSMDKMQLELLPSIRRKENEKFDSLMKDAILEKEDPATRQPKQLNIERRVEKKECSSPCKISTIPPLDTPNKQLKAIRSRLSPIMSKTSKVIKPGESTLYFANTQKTANSSLYGTSNSKNSELLHEKIQEIRTILKNPDRRETVSKRMEGNYTSFLKTAQRSINDVHRTNGSKQVFQTVPPGKDMRYGPPVPFSQSINSAKTKKFTVADQIYLCRGDTNEKVPKRGAKLPF